jgi:hypothetical protein
MTDVFAPSQVTEAALCFYGLISVDKQRFRQVLLDIAFGRSQHY